MSYEEKVKIIEKNMHEIMSVIGLDTTDPSIKDTPMRVAKMYAGELFAGLH